MTENIYALLLGVQLEGKPKGTAEFIEFKRGTLEETKAYGSAILDSRIGEKGALFSMPDEWIIANILSEGDKTRTFFVTGDNGKTYHAIDGEAVSWTKYEDKQAEYLLTGEQDKHVFEEKHIPGIGLRLRLIRVQ